MFKRIVFFTGCILASAAAAQQGAAPADPAALFGARQAVSQIDISPDGQRVVYLVPGPGESTYAVAQALDGESQARIILRSDGDPERLQGCDFVANDRLICRFYVLADGGYGTSNLLPFTRLLSVDLDGGDAQLLGQRQSSYDAYLRQFDGAIIDWLPDEDGAVLMSRQYVPEAGRLGTRMVRTTEGLGSTASTFARCARGRSSRPTSVRAATSATGAATSGSRRYRRSAAPPA